MGRLWLLLLLWILAFRGPRRSGGGGGSDAKGAAHGGAAFSARAGCPLGKSRRLREPGAQHRARRRGVLSWRHVSLHKQRKVARAVTARKLLMLLSSKMEKIKSSSLRSPPSSGAARHLLPQAGEGLPHPASGRRASSSGRREKG